MSKTGFHWHFKLSVYWSPLHGERNKIDKFIAWSEFEDRNQEEKNAEWHKREARILFNFLIYKISIIVADPSNILLTASSLCRGLKSLFLSHSEHFKTSAKAEIAIILSSFKPALNLKIRLMRPKMCYFFFVFPQFRLSLEIVSFICILGLKFAKIF